MVVFSLGSLWLAADDIAKAERMEGNQNGWILFGFWYLGGLTLGGLLTWLGYRFLKGTGLKYLGAFQGIGWALAGGLLVWKIYASRWQLVAIWGLLGGAMLFITAWFAWFLYAKSRASARRPNDDSRQAGRE
jgi:hypothetical protein